MMWLITFALTFVPYSVMVNVCDRDRRLPSSYSQWSHCIVDPSW